MVPVTLVRLDRKTPLLCPTKKGSRLTKGEAVWHSRETPLHSRKL